MSFLIYLIHALKVLDGEQVNIEQPTKNNPKIKKIKQVYFLNILLERHLKFFVK